MSSNLKRKADEYASNKFMSLESQLCWARMSAHIRRNMQAYPQLFLKEYVEGFNHLFAGLAGIPTVERLQERLGAIGWSTDYVDGFVPSHLYIGMLARKVFPISTYVRGVADFDLAVKPDFVHDVLGHLPLLFSPEYRENIVKWAEKANWAGLTEMDERYFTLVSDLVAASHDGDREQAERLQEKLKSMDAQLNHSPTYFSKLTKYYARVFEFGMVMVDGVPKVLGAAIYSSPEEFKNIVMGQCEIAALDQGIFRTSIDFTKFQDRFYSAESFDLIENLLISI